MNALNLTKETLQELVKGTDKPILLDFWAPWCGPCQQIGPIVEQIAREREDIVVGKVNVDEEMELGKQFRVLSIPTLVVFKNGKVAAKAVGLRSKSEILKLLD